MDRISSGTLARMHLSTGIVVCRTRFWRMNSRGERYYTRHRREGIPFRSLCGAGSHAKLVRAYLRNTGDFDAGEDQGCSR